MICRICKYNSHNKLLFKTNTMCYSCYDISNRNISDKKNMIAIIKNTIKRNNINFNDYSKKDLVRMCVNYRVNRYQLIDKIIEMRVEIKFLRNRLSKYERLI